MSNAYFTRAIHDRVLEILCDGHGYGAHEHAIPSGVFRRCADRRRVDDPGLAVEAADRAVEWRWTELDRMRTPSPTTSGRGIIRADADLLISYLYGPGTESATYLPSVAVTGEDPEEASWYVHDRALADAEKIYLALRTQALWADLTSPSVFNVDRVLSALLVEQTPAYEEPARLVLQAKFFVEIDRNNTSKVTP